MADLTNKCHMHLLHVTETHVQLYELLTMWMDEFLVPTFKLFNIDYTKVTVDKNI